MMCPLRSVFFFGGPPPGCVRARIGVVQGGHRGCHLLPSGDAGPAGRRLQVRPGEPARIPSGGPAPPPGVCVSHRVGLARTGLARTGAGRPPPTRSPDGIPSSSSRRYRRTRVIGAGLYRGGGSARRLQATIITGAGAASHRGPAGRGIHSRRPIQPRHIPASQNYKVRGRPRPSGTVCLPSRQMCVSFRASNRAIAGASRRIRPGLGSRQRFIIFIYISSS